MEASTNVCACEGARRKPLMNQAGEGGHPTAAQVGMRFVCSDTPTPDLPH